MQRWERTVDGRSDVWEFERAGAVITERASSAGATPIVREHHCDSEATAEGVRLRMVAQRERQGYARAAGAVEAPAVARPSYPGLTDAQVEALILRVGKAAGGEAYGFGEAIQKVTGAWEGRHAIGWFLLEHGLVEGERMPGFWDFLAEDAALADPATVLALLAKVPTGKDFSKLFKYGPGAWWVAGSARSLDVLLFAAYQRDPALFEDRGRELGEAARRSLDFVRGRSGVAVASVRARSLLTEFATVQVKHGLASNQELARVDDGAVTRPRVSDPAAVRAVALRFGTAADWDAAMVKAALAAKQIDLRNAHDALRACTAAELATLLARRGSFGSNDQLALELRLVEVDRDDAPDALLAAAEALPDDNHARAVREMLAVIAARRFVDRGLAVPPSLVALLHFEFFSGVYHESIRPYVDGLRALPRADVMALAERALGEPVYYGRGLAALLAWPDDALLGRFFDRDVTNVYLEVEVVGRFGPAALPHLARVWESTPRERKRTRHQQILAALATAGDRGETVDPSWDGFITFDEEGVEALSYWDTSLARVRERALRALPPDRRSAVLLRGVTERRWPERALAAAHVLDDADARAAVTAAHTRRVEGAS